MKSNIKELIKVMLRCFEPPERITVTECAEKYRILPTSNREGGAYRVSRTPFAKEIMDSFNDPNVEEITIMGSAQWAKTTIMENIIAYIIKVQPSNILLVLPTLDFARRFSKTRLEPMIEDSPEIKKLVSKKKSRDSDNTILSKSFVGGTIAMVGANSPGGLRGFTAPYIFADDIDAIEIGSTKEGDFIARAERAAETYEGIRKFFRASTPSIAGGSRIEKYYNKGTMEEWHIPCPKCEEYQLFEISQLKWEYETDAFGKRIPNSDKPETAVIICKYCSHEINEGERQMIIPKGKWVAKFPDRIYHRSFFFNRFTSPFSSLRNICKAYIEAQGEEEKMQAFTNLYLGLPYKPDTVVELLEDEILQKVEQYLDPSKPYECPSSVLMLIASADVQDDRIEAQVWGYGMNYECWILNKFKLPGDPRLPKHINGSPWAQLEKVLLNTWKRTDGVELKIVAAGIDSSFLSDEVYAFCRGFEFTRNWWAIKGARNPFAEIIPQKYSVIEEKRSKYLRLGVNLEKQSMFSLLKMPRPENYDGEPLPKYIHLDESICDLEFVEQLTSEHGVKRTSGSVEYIVYVKKKSGLRNEALDLMVYNRIMAKIQNPNWQKLKENIDARKNKNVENEKSLPEPQTLLNKPTMKVTKVKPFINKITNW
jgi:phage terminase large subunit GpA-like protein